MPWYPDVSVRLTDAQLWAIVCADPTVSNHQLAAQLGAVVGTVTHARRRLRQHGWTCPVSDTTCRYCRRPLTQRGRGRRRNIFHADCKPAAVRVRRRGPDRRRWDALPIEVRRDHLARVRAFEEEHQEATKATARQRHAHWTDTDDAVLIARHDAPAYVLATELGRTLLGIYRRRTRLQERGVLPGD